MAKRIVREITSDGTKFKMSIRKQGVLNPMSNKPRPEEVKQKISDSMKKYWSEIPSIHDAKDNNDKKK